MDDEGTTGRTCPICGYEYEARIGFEDEQLCFEMERSEEGFICVDAKQERVYLHIC